MVQLIRCFTNQLTTKDLGFEQGFEDISIDEPQTEPTEKEVVAIIERSFSFIRCHDSKDHAMCGLIQEWDPFTWELEYQREFDTKLRHL